VTIAERAAAVGNPSQSRALSAACQRTTMLPVSY
jgi:hypothetical protein